MYISIKNISINSQRTCKFGVLFRGSIYARYKYLGKKVFDIVNQVYFIVSIKYYNLKKCQLKHS